MIGGEWRVGEDRKKEKETLYNRTRWNTVNNVRWQSVGD